MKVLYLGWLIAVWSFGMGCSHTSNTGEDLFKSVRTFNEHIRWNRYQLASKYLPVQKREPWLTGMQAAGETLRIVDYRMDPVRITSTRSIVDVYLASYRISNPVIERQRRRQWWSFNGKTWQLEADRRMSMRQNTPKAIPDIGTDKSDELPSENIVPPADR